MPEGYCVKCKAKQEMKDEKMVEMKGKGGVKRSAMTGVCPVCGTKPSIHKLIDYEAKAVRQDGFSSKYGL